MVGRVTSKGLPVTGEIVGDVLVYQRQEEGRVRDWVMYTVSRAGRGESEGLGDVHCIKGREGGE